MNGKPEVVRPFSSRNPPNSARQNDMYAARNQMNAIKNSREPITIDEIISLKREKQNLTQERYILKAKIARFSDATKRPNPPNRNIQIANSLEKQVKTLEQLVAAKKQEIADLIYSDRAALVTELQEESKMLHLESNRLKKLKQDTEAELKKLSLELEEACEKYSPQVLNRQGKAIRGVEKEIEMQKARNDKIQKKIDDAIKAQEEQKLQEKHENLQKQIDSLKQKIRQEQNEINGLDRQMRELQENHTNEILEYQSRL
ncbi:hypothetical protein TRFO_15728 [Tritrichomonas foetus]|uniref:Uncharacterized protein n=1 Tax=Tritrichomonas foetus TaxID=1144522 RepID=A0A1J4KRP1_9EUKA|nr:hypothetical protein TRFO_15728 [Tritrichomonas foetus]|eukprot:OHT13961.1 hypothetical protein TRFO_15728 [Tritrichomonas foetus]